VELILKKLDEQSTPGPDELHPRIMKHLAQYISSPLAKLFRKSIDDGRLPAAWKTAIVKPMFKGGTKSDPANYRPVSLTSVICKVLERIVKEEIECHFRDAGLWAPEQHGFQRGKSCTTNLLLARERWAKSVDAGGSIDVIYVDFSKAFDRVPHQRLMLKLASYGISGKIYTWIGDFLSGRTMRVKVNDCLSESVICTSGVPQGSVLGPELFKVYVNDLPQHISTTCLMYADDLKIWSEVITDDDVEVLQPALNELNLWSDQWLLPINYDKCCVLPVGRRQPVGIYHLGGYLLRESMVERDLGVMVTPDLKSAEESKRKALAASKLLWSIRRSFQRITPELFRRLFTSHVRPILEYGQPAFCPITKRECQLLERVQRRGTKAVEGLQKVPYPNRLEKLGLFSLHYRRLRGDLLYTWRILRGLLGNELREYFDVMDKTNRRGHSYKLYKHRRTRLNPLVTLSTRVVNVWNDLPDELVSTETEQEFKRKLDKRLQNLSSGNCLLCDHCDFLRKTSCGTE
jgi:hypothetical protein